MGPVAIRTPRRCDIINEDEVLDDFSAILVERNDLTCSASCAKRETMPIGLLSDCSRAHRHPQLQQSDLDAERQRLSAARSTISCVNLVAP